MLLPFIFKGETTMGCFSWLDCKTKKQIRIGFYGKEIYVLVPKEFGGGHIVCNFYEGYGEFGGYDIYDLVAAWNREYLKKYPVSEPRKEQFGSLYSYQIEDLKKQGKTDEEIAELCDNEREKYYQAALKRYNVSKNIFDEFISAPKGISFEDLLGMFDGRLRDIGIDIACENKDNKKLKYPIKITYDKDAIYEECSYSLSDPNQGL